VGDVVESCKGVNTLIQKVGSKNIYYRLTNGTPIADLESMDSLREKSKIAEIKNAYIKDAIDIDTKKGLDFGARFKLLKFIVDELFPRMVASPLDERIDAIFDPSKKINTGKEIITEALGSKLETKVRNITLSEHIIERMQQNIDRGVDSEFRVADVRAGRYAQSTTEKQSVFSKMVKGNSIMILNGHIYFCEIDEDSNFVLGQDLMIRINDEQSGYCPTPIYYKQFLESYERYLSHNLKVESVGELKKQIKDMNHIVERNIDYMPLMDIDELRFRDIGYYRNGDIIYVFTRIPKFARQTTYDESLYNAKEFDSDGYAGELGIGLCIQNGDIEYAGGVTYRGPIKKDAPFTLRVQINDPVMRAKYGELTTVCHVGGYPQFPMSPDGFTQFMTYALSNFLDSFRQRFMDDHYNLEEQARLLDAGKLLTKDRASESGYLLTNIHKIKS
jgi:hypothetical protein